MGRITGWLTLLMVACASVAHAQNWPTRPVRILVGFSPGSATDISARMLAPKLEELWKQPVVIENRSGAGSSIANAMVAKATPDGYTILMISASFAINAVLQNKASYDPIKDFNGVTQVGFSTGVIVASPALGVKTLKELIAAANARPGKILFGSAGAGSGVAYVDRAFQHGGGHQGDACRVQRPAGDADWKLWPGASTTAYRGWGRRCI